MVMLTLLAAGFFAVIAVCVAVGLAVSKVFPWVGEFILTDSGVLPNTRSTAKIVKKLVPHYKPLSAELTGYTEFADGGELIHYDKDGYTITGRSWMSGDELIHYDKDGFQITGRTRKY
jgi:hypothetical protein